VRCFPVGFFPCSHLWPFRIPDSKGSNMLISLSWILPCKSASIPYMLRHIEGKQDLWRHPTLWVRLYGIQDQLASKMKSDGITFVVIFPSSFYLLLVCELGKRIRGDSPRPNSAPVSRFASARGTFEARFVSPLSGEHIANSSLLKRITALDHIHHI
jgi:hypothetical protein